MSDLVLSLFPGLELLDRAFRAEGFCVVAGPDRLLGGDVREFHAPPGRFDGVIGGSPCQSFSALANLVRAKGLEPRFGNLVPEFERVVVEAAPLWFLHENVPRAPIPQPAGYSVRDFTICNSSIEGDDGLGQEQERVRRFAFGVNLRTWLLRQATAAKARGESFRTGASVTMEAPNLLRWIPRAALRLPAASRASVIAEPVNNSPEAKGRVRSPTVAYDDGPGTRERLRLPPLAGENGTKHETRRTRQASVLADPGSENRRSRVGAVSHDATVGKRDQARGKAYERRSLPEMLRLQGLPEDLLDDQPFTSKAARKMVANGVPMPLGLAVARAVRMALESIDPDLALLSWRDAEVSEMIRRGA